MAGPARHPRPQPRLTTRLIPRLTLTSPSSVLGILSLVTLVVGALPTLLPPAPPQQVSAPPNPAQPHPVETLPAVDQAEPSYFTPQELAALERHFGVHGAQPELAQLFFEGVGQFRPLRRQTLRLLETVRPTLIQECNRQHVNPMLVAAVLYEEVQLAKPGEHLPVAAHSGLIRTHGPAQISLEELVIQGRLRPDATEAEKYAAVDRLLDPEENVRVLVSKFARLSRKLKIPGDHVPQITGGAADLKTLATLAYLYNGKLDYPGRILRHMEDPELHGLIYSQQQTITSALI